MALRGFLFDLDGTLADTAPDLVAVLNALLRAEGLPPMPYAIARNEVSNGALGLLRLGFGLSKDTPVDESLRERFLAAYAARICVGSRLFLDIGVIRTVCGTSGARWGIVTNKPAAFTEPLLELLPSCREAGCVVSGDTLPQRKPHPAPLLHAAEVLGLAPGECVYVGDARRDIDAGKAAGMRTIAAAYGYVRFADRVETWGADWTVRSPAELHRKIESLACSEAP